MKKIRLDLYLSEELVKKIRDFAAENGLTATSAASFILNNYFKSENINKE